MVSIQVLAVGSLKETYLKDAVDEYLKRLSRYANITIKEVKESRLPKNATNKNIQQSIETESESLLAHTKGFFVIALDAKGKHLTSEQFASKLQDTMTYASSNIAFLIGGSHGLSKTIKKHANLILSFSNMTFPHQLMRVIVLEQLYRAMTILNNEPYHK